MNILFISEILPVNTQASSVVFYRHLTDLEKRGHKIFVVTDKNSIIREKERMRKNWVTVVVPNRSLFLPPYKPYGLLQTYRFAFYYYRYLSNFIKKNKIDYLVGYINGQFLAPLTTYLKKKTNLPLITFYHDDNLELHYSDDKKIFQSLKKNTESLIIASNKVLVASEEFQYSWPAYADKFELLYPLPESADLKHSTKSDGYNIGYSGSMYNELISPLSQLARNLENKGVLFIISNRSLDFKDETNNIINLPLFATTLESNNFLVKNCDALVIPYPEDMEDMKWIKTCFPSKFIQACQLEIPILVIAPTNSAIGKWCVKNNWDLYSNSYESEIINSLLDKLHQAKAVDDTKKSKLIHFNIDKIKNQFASNFL